MDATQIDVGEIFEPAHADINSAVDLVLGVVFDFRKGWNLAANAGRNACWMTVQQDARRNNQFTNMCTTSEANRRPSWTRKSHRGRDQALGVVQFSTLIAEAHFLHLHQSQADSHCCSQCCQTAFSQFHFSQLLPTCVTLAVHLIAHWVS